LSSLSAYRYPFPPFPVGWYCLGFSDELAAGQVVTRTFMGEEVVLFRTMTGKFAITDAHCPHLGGHLGRGGEVKGETLRCPFHGFCFDTAGVCTETGYGTKPPSRATLRVWPSQEMNGLLMAYYHPSGDAPNWTPPALDDTGWTPLSHRQFEVRSHPQETSENSVDFGHFSIVHGYTDTDVLTQLTVDGPYLSGKYVLHRPADVFLQSGTIIRAEFEVHVWGLGYSLVDVWVEQFNLRTRVFVLSTPIDGERINIYSAASVSRETKPSDVHWALRVMPQKWAYRLLTRAALKGYCDDLEADFEIWENKAYIHPPILAKGDGPILKYRKYCRQFYPHHDEWAKGAGRTVQEASSQGRGLSN